MHHEAVSRTVLPVWIMTMLRRLRAHLAAPGATYSNRDGWMLVAFVVASWLLIGGIGVSQLYVANRQVAAEHAEVVRLRGVLYGPQD